MEKYNKIYKLNYLLYILFIFVFYLLILTNVLPASLIHITLILSFIPVFLSAIKKLKEKKIGTEFFLTIATIISLFGNQEKAMNIVLIIMLVAEYLEDLISERTEKEIKSLINLMPKDVIVKIDDEEKVVPISQIKIGMSVIVKTGGSIPVDGYILQGSAMVNEASLTGESISKQKMVGQQVYAGTFLEAGSIIIRTEKIGEDTFFGKISSLVHKSEGSKAKISILTDKIAFYFVPTLLVFIGLTWLLTKNLNLVTTLLVFGSPLELTLITPLAILAGIIAAFKNGILVKGGLVLEKLSKSDTIIFDKTGTLTMGEPEIAKIELFDQKYNEKEILKIAAIAQKRSDHVVAKAILKKAKTENIVVADPENYISLPGHGVEITYNNENWFMGNKHFIESPEHGNINLKDIIDEQSQYDEYSSFYIGSSGKLYGKIYMSDTIRNEAKQTVNDLKKLGFKDFILLSGDRQKIASNVGSSLGITKSYGEVFPDKKLLVIENLQKEKHIVTMVGDGVNDAPALKQADIGIAMGAMGMEPAIEAADIILVANDLYKIVFVYALSKRIFKVIWQNILFGFILIHGFGIILTFLGYVTPLKAALFHAVSDLGILINSARLINFKLKKS